MFLISIRALREEGDQLWGRRTRPLRDFYPRPPRGGRRRRLTSWGGVLKISIHALREEGDLTAGDILLRVGVISIHALREEGDLGTVLLGCGSRNFYPRPPRGGRRQAQTMEKAQANFYPRPPRGGRRASTGYLALFVLFLSTPSARRATTGLRVSDVLELHFYPRPPRGGRPATGTLGTGAPGISIHALREEGDLERYR